MYFPKVFAKISIAICLAMTLVILKYSFNVHRIFENLHRLQRSRDHQREHRKLIGKLEKRNTNKMMQKFENEGHTEKKIRLKMMEQQKMTNNLQKYHVTTNKPLGHTVERRIEKIREPLHQDDINNYEFKLKIKNYTKMKPSSEETMKNQVRATTASGGLQASKREKNADRSRGKFTIQIPISYVDDDKISRKQLTYSFAKDAKYTDGIESRKAKVKPTAYILTRGRKSNPMQKAKNDVKNATKFSRGDQTARKKHSGRNLRDQSYLSELNTSNSIEKPELKAEKTNDAAKYSPEQTKNLYLQNVGNFSIYGDTTCSKNSNRNILEKILKKWIVMANESGIEFFLTCGTLLGSYRNGELIPYDSDMDILVHEREFKKLKKYESKRKFTGYENDFHVAIQQDFGKPYSKRKRYTCNGKLTPVYKDHCSFIEPMARLITENRHLDIYDYTVKGNEIDDPSEGGRKFDTSEVFPLQKCILMGHATKCPHKPKEFLRKFYGEDLSPNKICRNGTWVKKS